jgi:hypothetical protein
VYVSRYCTASSKRSVSQTTATTNTTTKSTARNDFQTGCTDTIPIATDRSMPPSERRMSTPERADRARTGACSSSDGSFARGNTSKADARRNWPSIHTGAIAAGTSDPL